MRDEYAHAKIAELKKRIEELERQLREERLQPAPVPYYPNFDPYPYHYNPHRRPPSYNDIWC